MKKVLIILIIISLLSFYGCDFQDDVNKDNNNEIEDNTYLAKDFDFGDENSWAGDQIVVEDLGDCILDAFPYDERYDWGQSILYDSEEKIHKMWWCRHSGFDSIWYAESKDLKHWYNAIKLIAVSENSTWIKLHVGKPTVIKVNNKYIMYFEAPATLNELKEFNNNVFYATSDDGKKWNIWANGGNEPYPVIRMSDSDMLDSWNASQEAGGSGYGYYGIGQPSVTYKDGVFYLYCTYSLYAGDRMYLFKSTDGIHFDNGTQVFLRAGSGVKYNTKTHKFMYAYEYTMSSLSKVYYMESTDGIHFTYDNYAAASNNTNILSKGGKMVRGYPDFVCNELGQVDGYTCYAAYMEGKMAESGADWRTYCSTWDIHISMFNPKEYANRTMVLPNGKVFNTATIKPYRDSHVVYEEQSVGIKETNNSHVIFVNCDNFYSDATVLNVSRISPDERAVPGEIHGTIKVKYSTKNLYLYVEVFDKTKDVSDYTYIGIDEKKYATDNKEITNIEFRRSGITVTDGNGDTINNVSVASKITNNGYVFEIIMPWRYKKAQEAYDEFGFECYMYNNRDSLEYKNVVCWNDLNLRYNVKYFGTLYFKK